MTRRLDDAQHEAAHVVVGVALGLRLRRAWLGAHTVRGVVYVGCAEWDADRWPREAGLLMMAAGVAWERRAGDLEHAADDFAVLRRAGIRGPGRLLALERAAWAVIMSRAGLHARLSRELVDHDIGPADIRRLSRASCRDTSDSD